MAATNSLAVRLFWKLHPHVYRWSRGRVLGTLLGMPVLLLTTTGRKSGQPRTTPLTFLPRGDDRVVIASYLGSPHHPAWYRNLAKTPEAEILERGRHIPVRARVAEGEERQRLWDEVVARVPDYAEYASRTERRIPVVVLEPR